MRNRRENFWWSHVLTKVEEARKVVGVRRMLTCAGCLPPTLDYYYYYWGPKADSKTVWVWRAARVWRATSLLWARQKEAAMEAVEDLSTTHRDYTCFTFISACFQT